MENNTFQHHGIKGQRWGVRRFQNKDGTLTAAGKQRAAKETQRDKEKNRKLDMKNASKNRRTLSDVDLQKRIERIQTERKLKDLTEEDLSPGKKFAKDVLTSSGRKVATTIVTGAALYAIKASMEGKFNPVDAAKYVAPNPWKKN